MIKTQIVKFQETIANQSSKICLLEKEVNMFLGGTNPQSNFLFNNNSMSSSGSNIEEYIDLLVNVSS